MTHVWLIWAVVKELCLLAELQCTTFGKQGDDTFCIYVRIYSEKQKNNIYHLNLLRTMPS